MDEARAVLARLERIERLDRRDVPASMLLAELRKLVVEAEAWARVEPGVTAREEGAVERLREAVSAAPIPALGSGRTLLA